MADFWRLAILFDLHDGGALEHARKALAEDIDGITSPVSLRIGVADLDPKLSATNYKERMSAWRTLDAVIEITVEAVRSSSLSALTAEVSPLVARFAVPGSVEVVAGPMHAIVPQKDGETFLSLAFRRDPRISTGQFSDWWLHTHAPLALPILGPDLLAYDQVHLDHAVGVAVAAALGVAPVDYDAYDNLTFPDREGFLHAVGDRDAMGRMFADEIGWIEDSSRRRALMRRIA